MQTWVSWNHSQTHADTKQSTGSHTIKYAIFPHNGSLGASTVRAAYNFNHPMRAVRSSNPELLSSILRSVTVTGSPSLILDCVKRGEDDEDVSRGELPSRKGRSIIIRIYEALGGQARGAIEWNTNYVQVKKVIKTNVLEDDQNEYSIKVANSGDAKYDGKTKIQLRPFEVATFRLQL